MTNTRRKIKGQHDSSERVSEREGFRGFQRFSEVCRGFERLSEVFQRPSLRGFSKALSETLLECRFPLRVAGRVAPNRVAP